MGRAQPPGSACGAYAVDLICGAGRVSTGSMQGGGRGEEERGETSEKGSGEERKRKQRAGRQADGTEGGAGVAGEER